MRGRKPGTRKTRKDFRLSGEAMTALEGLCGFYRFTITKAVEVALVMLWKGVKRP